MFLKSLVLYSDVGIVQIALILIKELKYRLKINIQYWHALMAARWHLLWNQQALSEYRSMLKC